MHKRLILAALVPAIASVLILGGSGAADSADLPGGVDEQPGIPPEVAAKMAAAAGGKSSKDELPSFDVVGKGYEKVVSSADGKKGLYDLWTRKKDAQVLAELPRNFESQTLFIAYTIAGGTPTSGVQTGDMYAKWKRFDKRLALIEPNFAVRTTGDLESKKGRERVFTDRVILDIPIVAKGPSGGVVVDMDALFVGQASRFFGYYASGAKPKLAKIAKSKSFPKNVEVAFELPLQGGRFATLHYSISVLPKSTGYKPRTADARVGYFTTSYRDIGHPGRETPWVRNVTRWKLEKADPKLKMSPPKEPIIFYLEHTIPVRYRRWVRDGVLEWNKAFEKVGLVNAIEVYQQDARTGAHMEKDPEDARYDFVLWTNAGMGFAIGPSRVDPRTGQIIDADIVMDEGFISSWVKSWEQLVPETAMRNFDPQTLAWLETRPEFDPRVLLASPASRNDVRANLVHQRMAAQTRAFSGHDAGAIDPTVHGDDRFDGLTGRVSQVNGRCELGMHCGFELNLFRLDPMLLDELASRSAGSGASDSKGDDDKTEDDEKDDDKDEDASEPKPKGQQLDGIPEWFIGPLLKGVVMHEVGHTLGLRHNFKASCIYSLAEINSPEWKGKPIVGSVMDYTPVNIGYDVGEEQGPFSMDQLGPYDYWAIEYGYSFDSDLKPILARVAEPELLFGTDEDSWGSDPRARVFDLGSNSLDYARSQKALVEHLRGRLLDRMVKDGDSWAKAREGYELLLNKHFAAVAIATNWVGGSYSNRDRKGDPGDRTPVSPVEAAQQREALTFAMEQMFRDEAFGLSPELLSKMSVDKWFDDGGFASIFDDYAWPIHDRVLALQSSTLSMLMNPSTLNRVYDNEFRAPADEDVLTLPDLLWGVSDEVWSELDKGASRRHTARAPMISSFRRNLQREHLNRLIDLTMPNARMGAAAKPAANLSMYKLRELMASISKVMRDDKSKLDPYTLAHLSEAQVRIDKALDAQYIYNTDDIGGGGMPFLLFGQPQQP